MTAGTPVLTRPFWRTRRSAAVAGIVFAVLMIVALVMIDYALAEGTLATLASDSTRRTAVRVGLGLMPFAGIAFLWFVGVVRERLGDTEDRLFSTVFMGSGLLFLAMLFASTVGAGVLVEMGTSGPIDAQVLAFGSGVTSGLVSQYAMRMAAVFTLSVTTLGFRTKTIPRWLAVLGYLVALVFLISPDGQTWVPFVFPGWVLLLSVTLMVLSARTDRPATTPLEEQA